MARGAPSLLCRLAGIVLLAGSALAPVAAGLDTELEKQIGKAVAATIEAETGVLDSAFLDQWVGEIGAGVARVSGRQDLKFRFKILASPEVNALALPGGHVYVNQGLLSRLTSESELAGVLAHEVAHLHDKDFQRLVKRELVFLGLLSLARREDSRSLEIGVGLVQVLNSLRYSRKHEAQADAVGIKLAIRAGYDPQGVVEFLNYIAAGRGEGDWLSTALATHPHAAVRLKRATALARQAERADYDRLMRLAARLVERGCSHRPLELYATASEIDPGAPEPHLRRACVLTTRARWTEAAEAYELADRLAGSSQFAAQVRNLRQRPGASGELIVPAPSDVVQGLVELEGVLRERAEANASVRKRIWQNIRRTQRDRRVQQALTYGQVLDAEWDSGRFIGTLVSAWVLLRRCVRWPGEALEACRREAEIRSSLRRLTTTARTVNSGAQPAAADRVNRWLQESGLSTADQAADALEPLAPHADEVRDATIQCSVVLLALMGTGENAPLGEMNWTRFAVTSAQLVRARNRLERAQAALDDAQDAVTEAAVRAIEAELDWEGAQAPWRQAHPYAVLLAPRFGVETSEFLTIWREKGGLGAAARIACERALREDKPAVAREAQFILMRLAGNDVRAERLSPAWAASAAPWTASTLATMPAR